MGIMGIWARPVGIMGIRAPCGPCLPPCFPCDLCEFNGLALCGGYFNMVAVELLPLLPASLWLLGVPVTALTAALSSSGVSAVPSKNLKKCESPEEKGGR